MPEPFARRPRRVLRRVDILVGTAIREAPGMTAVCALTALGAGLLGVAYPIGASG